MPVEISVGPPVLTINPGSAGEARDQGNGRQLSCAMLDTVSDEVVVTDYPEVQLVTPRVAPRIHVDARDKPGHDC